MSRKERRVIMGLYLMVFLIIALYGWLNYHIGVWLWNHLFFKLSLLSFKGFMMILFLFMLTSLVGVAFNRNLPSFFQDGFYLFASYWLVGILYFTMLLALYQFIYFLNKWLNFIPPETKENPLAGIIVVSIVIVLFAFGTINSRVLKITAYNVNMPKQAGSLEQLHVAFLTDLHLSDFEDSGMAELVETINQLNPDLVLLAGDIIDANRDTGPRELEGLARYFPKIKSKYGIYASLGNHDYDFKGDSAERVERFQRAGVKILRDSSVKIADSFYLIGREDISYERTSGQKRQELFKLVEDLAEKLPVLVLDHQPFSIAEAKEAGVDLLLCGHTHNGQLFPINLFTERIFLLDYGYLKLDDFQVIVSSGARTWGPPIRIGSNSEIVSLTINYQ